MKKTIIALTGLLALLPAYYGGRQFEVNPDEQFQQFIVDYRRSYFSRDEYSFRLGVFKQNLEEIQEMNANSEFGAKFGITQFADQTKEEREVVLGLPKNRVSDDEKRDDHATETPFK